MTALKLNLMIRVFNGRMAAGETFEEVAATYPKLTASELEEIRAALK